MTFDPLSFGGKMVLYPPLFHAILGFFGNSLLLIRFVYEVLFAFSVVSFYLLGSLIVQRRFILVLGTLFYVGLPILIEETLNTLSVYVLVFPLLFLVLYAYLRSQNQRYVWLYIVGLFLLGFAHSSIILLLLGFLFFLFLSAGQDLFISQRKKELIFLALLLTFFLLFLIYKNAFLLYGLDVIWQNVPHYFFTEMYSSLESWHLLLGLGLLPFLFGLYGLYVGFFKQHREVVYLISGILLSTFLLLGFQLIPLELGLLFVGVFMCFLSLVGMDALADFLPRLRFSQQIPLLLFLFILIFSGFLPTYQLFSDVQQLDPDLSAGMEWLSTHSDPEDVVLASVFESNVVHVLAQRRTLLDTDFLLAPSVDERFQDVGFMYRGLTEIKVASLLKKYSVDYMILSQQDIEFYGVDSERLPGYRCFNQVEDTIYEVIC